MDGSQLIQVRDIAVIKTNEDHPYHLLKLLENPYETEEMVIDDYQYQFLPAH